ncbi:hypothetical protein [Streptomyces sp. NPDC007088]|uniref:hypothetical protein n=1 Tax=Streptomyces sp. NPDC007088 TaxID=3364773 RepID=UPI0036D0CA34
MPGSEPDGRGLGQGGGYAIYGEAVASVLALPERIVRARPLLLLLDEAWFLSQRRGSPDAEPTRLLQQGRDAPSSHLAHSRFTLPST